MSGPGKIILLGSGETSASGRKIFDFLFRSISEQVNVAILETPAGFELNSEWVAGQVAEFLEHRLQNFRPIVQLIPARKRGTSFSPDDPDIVSPLLSANVIYMGAGSPTYAVRQLQNSLAWHTTLACHQMGSNVMWTSAAPLAISAYTLPVYEIYKVGEELHWKEGLDFFEPYGLSLVFVPHWNNQDGGSVLDTSRCYLGVERFSRMVEMLPKQATVVGIEEHTALVIDIHEGTCQTMGKGGVILLREGKEQRYDRQTFSLEKLGPFHLPALSDTVPEEILTWISHTKNEFETNPVSGTPTEVLDLLEKREGARERQEWEKADRLRQTIQEMGWIIQDTQEGPDLVPNVD